MIVSIDVDDDGWNDLPALEELTRAAAGAACAKAGIAHENLEAAILFTSDAAISGLNSDWRGKPHATNVLAFPAGNFAVPRGEAKPLGDIVLASGVIVREAAEQGKTLPGHVSHLIVHGVLHLLGYDHQTDEEARQMECLETEILKGLGYPDPYERH